MSTIDARAGSNVSITALVKSSDGTANLTLQTNSTNAVIFDPNQNTIFTSTGAVRISSGTTAQRPSPAVDGMVRYNTDYALLEGYANGSWVAMVYAYSYTATYLVVAGGGASVNSFSSGGGGAGGLVTGSSTLNRGTVYTISVGAGGALGSGGASSNVTGTGFTTVTTVGGGVGAGFSGTGGTGGSGGGASGYPQGGDQKGLGTAGQGNNGGSASGSYQVPHIGAGGGGGIRCWW